MSTCSDCGKMIINTRGAYSLGIPVCQCRPPMSESLRELAGGELRTLQRRVEYLERILGEREDPPQLPLAFD
jgi:hypothetical protein